MIRFSIVSFGMIGAGMLTTCALAATPDLADPGDLRDLPVSKRIPTIRSEAMAAATPASVTPSWLALAQHTRLMSQHDIDRAARIVALAPDRRVAGTGDQIHVHSDAMPPGASFELRRLTAPIVDPDTGMPIARAARRIGHARLLSTAPPAALRAALPGALPIPSMPSMSSMPPVPPLQSAQPTLHTLQVIEASEELMTGDLLVPAIAPASMTAFSPAFNAGSALGSAPAHAPVMVPPAAVAMQGRIAAVLQDSVWASAGQMVALNRGAQHGLKLASVAQVVRPVRIGPHDAPQFITPATGIDDTLATLLVVEVLDRAALAIVMRATDPVSAGARFWSMSSAASSTMLESLLAPAPVPVPVPAPVAAPATVGATR